MEPPSAPIRNVNGNYFGQTKDKDDKDDGSQYPPKPLTKPLCKTN